MIYFLIGLFASLIGAVSGIGGGVIIKPVLDFYGQYPVATIGMLSSVTVFFMSATSLIRHVIYGTKIQKGVGSVLGLGSMMGGVVGELLLSYAVGAIAGAKGIKLLQNGMLGILLIIALFYMNGKIPIPSTKLENKKAVLGVGVGLGMVSTFLGIGGGPINLVVLRLLFSMDMKESSVNSIILILFAQISKIGTVGITTGFQNMDLSMLFLMIPAGIIGGLLGARWNKKLSLKQILWLFNGVMLLIITLTGYHIFSVFQ